MRALTKITLTIVVLLGMFMAIPLAAETGHYPLGVEGIKAATLPPPGLYLRNYLYYYNSDVYRDRGGNNNGADLDLDALVIAPRLVWITDQKILGADYGMDIFVPLVQTDLEIDTPVGRGKFNDFCIGDIGIEPIDLAWHGDCYDLGAAFAVWLPTGKYNKNNPASPGKDFWTTMFTFGGTYYFDEEKTWSASLLSRYEIHSYKDHTDVRPGQNILFEWGIGKTIKKIWEVGVAGYSQWQISSDDGKDAKYVYDTSVHDRVSAIGPEASVFLPPLKMQIVARCLFEFSAVDRPEGVTTTVMLMKIF